MTNSSILLARSSEVVVLESLIGIILTVSAIAGNVLVLASVYRNPHLRKVSNVYIVCLSLTDFFNGVLVFPIIDAALISGKFHGGHILCWFQGIICFFLVIASILAMVMIAVQRYYKIVQPVKYTSIFSTRFVALSIVLVWSSALLLVILFSVRRGGAVFSWEFAMCILTPDDSAIVVFCVVGLFFPFFTMSFLYFKIWRFIRNHNAQMNHSNVNAEEVKLTKSLCIVLGAFAACYTPLCLTTSLSVVYEIKLPRQMFFFALSMIKFASVVNPIIYGVMNREFRTEFLDLVRCLWKSRVTARVEPVS